MSLKAFHVVFITVSVLMALGLSAWCMAQYFGPVHAGTDHLIGGVVALVAAVGLIAYEVYFLKKVKNISYL